MALGRPADAQVGWTYIRVRISPAATVRIRVRVRVMIRGQLWLRLAIGVTLKQRFTLTLLIHTPV